MQGRKPERRYLQVYEFLKKGILTGKFPPGSRLLTERQLQEMFGVSRPTAVRAYLELSHDGLITRCRGSGSYVRPASENPQRRLFGVMISGLFVTNNIDYSIFASLTGSLAGFARERGASILFHGALHEQAPAEAVRHARKMAAEYRDAGVSGVFFVPLLLPKELAPVNQEIAESFRRAGVSVVLLDRDINTVSGRSDFDLSALDHRQAGRLLTEHLLERGCRRIDFVTGATAAPSIQERVAGWLDALQQKGITPGPDWLHPEREFDPAAAPGLVRACRKADGVICYNDDVAVYLGLAFERAGVRVPQDLRLAGFDQAPVARQLPYRLTTITQPVGLIGQGGVDLMLQRIKSPDGPVQTRLFAAKLVIGESTA